MTGFQEILYYVLTHRKGLKIINQEFNLEETDLVNRMAKKIVSLKMGTVAILMIESVRPMNLLGSQLLHFFSPFVQTFGDFQDYKVLSKLLEKRESIDFLLETIEKEEIEFEKSKS